MAKIARNVLISYDITSKHDDVKEAMKLLNYQDYIYQINTNCQLPQSTLFHNQKYPKTAHEDFLKVINDINVTLEEADKIKIDKFVSAEATDFYLQ